MQYNFRLAMLVFFNIIFAHAMAADYEECCCDSYPFYGEVNLSYDHFRGISEGSWNDNTGGFAEVNFGVLVADLFGIQAGGSYGVYDWQGRGPVGSENPNGVQQQGFLTGGAFYTTPCCTSGFQAGAVVDWMFNRNFGVFGLNPNFGQVRFQGGYLFNASDEIGIWGTAYLSKNHKSTFQIPVSFRAINQVNLFWRHLFCNCAETMVWAGIPYSKSLMFSGKRAGKYIVGASFSVPLTASLAVEGHGMYMGPNGNHASPRYKSYGANICIGITYAFGCNKDDCCALWQARPYLPVANNSNFLVDSSLND